MNKTNYNGEPLQNQQKKFNGSNKNLLLYLIDHNVKTFSQKTTKQLIQIFDSLKQSLSCLNKANHQIKLKTNFF